MNLIRLVKAVNSLPQWFGSSGIRGSYGKITPQFSMKLGMAVGKTLKTPKQAYIASDIRFTSNLLKSAFMSGFSYVSGTITDVGLCPTPVISYISSIQNDTLGVMVTASHNPPSNNGFKFFLDGGECGQDFETEVEKKLQSELERPSSYRASQLSWKKAGTSRYKESKIYITDYVNYLLSKVKIENFETKIILDCANNVPNLVSPYALRKIGFKDVITINDTLDGYFPGRLSEPSSANLSVLKKVVVEEGADIGIAHDGDGDRFAMIDEQGNFINPTATINFFLDHLDYSNPARRKIILTSDCSNQAYELAENHQAEIITSRIGRNREYVNDDEILFLGEPNKLLFPELGKWIDGLYPILKLIEISKSKKISDLLAPYDKGKILRKAFKIAEEERIRVNSLLENLPELWAHKISKVSLLDGLKLFFKDKSSVLIRFSGTEPKIKFYVESHSVNKNWDLLSQLRTEFELNTEGIDC